MTYPRFNSNLALLFLLLVTVGIAFWPKKSPVITPVAEIIPTATPAPKTCPTGFIMVPGSSLYHTADFCVMKYDAKCALISDLSAGLAPPAGDKCTTEGTYKNNGAGCACIGDKQVVSTASGFPLTYLAETDATPNNAKSYCQSLGWHLLTNPEWMTIARNVATVPANWCDKNGTACGYPPGTPGKILANGHNDSSAAALVAGPDDQPCFGTTTDGSTTCGGPSSQKRTLALTNGSVIWDLAGNVWQWVDIQVLRRDQPHSQTGGQLDSGWIWSEFAPGGLSTVITDNGQGSALGYDSFRPSHPDWTSLQGVGRIYHYSSAADTSSSAYTFIRGGNWRHGYDSGAFTVHMSPMATTENIDDVGFRCAAYLL